MPKIRFSAILFLALLLAGCASTIDDKTRLMSFGNEGVYIPKNPYLFIPGLGFTGDFWAKSKAFDILKKDGWIYGGDVKVIRENGNIKIKPGNYKPGQFYTMTFSGTQMAIIQQGKELAVVIDEVQRLNNAKQIILIGHSMGGLAAREYLQSDYYGNDVRAYMSVGTPHLGSNFDLKKPILRLVPKFIQNMFWYVDQKSDAVRDLRTNSIYLNGGYEGNSPSQYRSKDINGNGTITDTIVGLNEIDKHPLPTDVFYISVIGGGNAPISTIRQARISDGIVDIDSQDMNEVPKVNVLSFVILSSSDHFGEANDVLIFMQAARVRQYMTRLANAKQISTNALLQVPIAQVEDEAPF